MNGRFGSFSPAADSVSRLESSVRYAAMAIIAAVAVGCGGSERVPDGDHFKDVVVIDNERIFAECTSTGVWPGHGNDITEIALPPYYPRQEF